MIVTLQTMLDAADKLMTDVQRRLNHGTALWLAPLPTDEHIVCSVGWGCGHYA